MNNRKREYLRQKNIIFERACEQIKHEHSAERYRFPETETICEQIWTEAKEEIRQLRIQYRLPIREDYE